MADGTGPRDRRHPLDPQLVAQGKEIFRFDPFGDEAYWTDTLRMNEVIESAVSPAVALSVGLKVDADALPQAVKQAIAAGDVDLEDPATTLVLLELDAVVGVKGTVETVNGVKRLSRVGITCALCHSTVDNSFAPGIGKRLDGWPNRDLNVGAIVALSPEVQLFDGAAGCAECHVPRSSFTDVNRGVLHDPSETGMDPAYARRTTQKRYRTTPLRGAWQHPPYFHDGSAATLADVVAHYNSFLQLGLTAQQRADLVEYLKSL